jgi:hypothetical protein
MNVLASRYKETAASAFVIFKLVPVNISSYRGLFLWDLFGFIKKIPVHFEINPTCPSKCG